jgi:hypothetical protein
MNTPGMHPRNQVRSRLPAGGRWIRTLGPPRGSAAVNEPYTVQRQARSGTPTVYGHAKPSSLETPEIRFAVDSTLEGAGFEPLVPRHAGSDCRRLAQDALRAATAYRALRQRFLDVQLWPGDHGAAEPEHLARPQGDEKFVIAPPLRNLCNACAVIGCVRYALTSIIRQGFWEPACSRSPRGRQ